ncbi:MAG: PQQ-binding-like beta-propeller repeat protein, partial [Gammaproteobacteria bacterium]|nr:PQQ-binding-like beta-propeller repeat protein [Gammaproteobacteria bacterium]
MRLSHVPNLRLLKPLLIVSLFLSAIVGCQSKTPHSDNSSQATLTKQAAASNRSINSPVADPKLDKWVNQSIIERAANDGWRSHGRTYDEQRHSPLRDINTENVSNLGLEWYFDLQTDRGIEATPIVHNGMIYVTSAQSVLFALNAKTGEPVWQFDPKIDKAQSAYACCGAVNRGVAIWGESIFLGTLDGRLVSLDATTGSVNWDVLTIDKSR